MSGASIQKKLNKAYGKVARKIGFQADVYRISQDYRNPIDDQNWLESKPFSVSQNDKYSAPVGSNLWLAWIDPNLSVQYQLQVGDIVEIAETQQVYYIIDMHPIHPFRALECNSTISISSLKEYADDGEGWQPSSDVEFVTNMPAWVQQSGSSSIDGGFIPARSALSEDSPVYTIQLWMPEGSIKPNDIVTLKDGMRLTVQQAQWDIRGYKLIASEVK